MRTAVDHTKDESQSKTRPKLGNPLRLLCTWPEPLLSAPIKNPES